MQLSFDKKEILSSEFLQLVKHCVQHVVAGYQLGLTDVVATSNAWIMRKMRKVTINQSLRASSELQMCKNVICLWGKKSTGLLLRTICIQSAYWRLVSATACFLTNKFQNCTGKVKHVWCLQTFTSRTVEVYDFRPKYGHSDLNGSDQLGKAACFHFNNV